MNELQVAASIGLGAYETPNEVLNAIAPQLKELVRSEVVNAAAKVTGATKSDVWKAGLIGGAIGIVGGGLFGWALSKKFR